MSHWGPLNTLPLHTIEAHLSEATEPLEERLRNDPDADLIFLMETTPSGGTMLRLSDVGFITSAADTPASTPYPDRLLTPYNAEISIEPPDVGSATGDLVHGVIELESGDEELDARLAESWEGRQVTIKAGGTFDVGLASETTLTYAQFLTVLTGTIQSVGWSEGRIVLSLREALQKLSEPYQDVYEGSGAHEGGETIKGRYKPRCFGQVQNVEPVLIDAGLQIYQWNDGHVDAVTAVRDKGVELTSAGNVNNAFSTTVDPGTYKTQNSGGLIRLGALPESGTITLDGRGDKFGGVDYINTTGLIALRIAVLAGLLDPDDFEGGSLAGFPDTSVIGYVSNDGESALQAIANILGGIFGWVSQTRTGQLRIGQYTNPLLQAPAVTITDDTLNAYEEETELPPVWRVEVEYARNWTVQDSDALSDALSAEQRQIYSEVSKVEAVEDAAIKTTHKDARVLRIVGFQANTADAAALAGKVFDVLSQRARVARARVERQLFQRQPGDVVRIESSDSNLTTGRNYYLFSLAEDAAERISEWGLWG